MPDFAWDNTILNSSGSSSSNTSEVRKLIAKAYKSQLNITQQQQLENSLAKDSSLILHLDLTPVKVKLTTYYFIIIDQCKLNKFIKVFKFS
jgi:hypothetical protein